jgi:hypothetical protein
MQLMTFSNDETREAWAAKAQAMTDDELAATNEELNTVLRNIQAECEKNNSPLMIPMDLSAACIAVVTEIRRRHG